MWSSEVIFTPRPLHIHMKRGWEGARNGLDMGVKRKLCVHKELNTKLLVIQSVSCLT
jgi:hypothetical protein